MVRHLAAGAMLASLAAAAGLSVWWTALADGADRLEPAAQALGLIGALTAIAAERLAAERNRRHAALAGLTEELGKNRDILGDLRFTLGRSTGRRVYPRLLVSAADAVIASGALTRAADRQLISRLHDWRNAVADLNRRLDLTEMLIFLQGTPEVIGAFEEALRRDNGRLQRIDTMLADLLDSLPGGAEAGTGGQPTPRRLATGRPQPVAAPEPGRSATGSGERRQAGG